MRITRIDLQCYDILWFAIDNNGCIIAFTSGGKSDVPEFVCRSKSETERLEDFFMSLPNDYSPSKLLIDNDGSQLAIDAEELAQKGIYYFDTYSDIEYEYGYSKVSYPDKALHVSDLPSDIQKLLSDHIIDIDVSTEDRIIVKNAY